jgi:hypothetical protein
MESYQVVSSAIAEAWSFEDGSSVSIEEDSILKKECVYLEGPHGERSINIYRLFYHNRKQTKLGVIV